MFLVVKQYYYIYITGAKIATFYVICKKNKKFLMLALVTLLGFIVQTAVCFARLPQSV